MILKQIFSLHLQGNGLYLVVSKSQVLILRYEILSTSMRLIFIR